MSYPANKQTDDGGKIASPPKVAEIMDDFMH